MQPFKGTNRKKMNLIVDEDIFDAMADVAAQEGRHKSKIWELAARDYLRRKGRKTQPATAPASARS